MFGKRPSKPQNRIDCLIGAGTSIEGNVNFTGGLRVDGHIRGNVVSNSDTASTLVLSEQARIEGEIRVSHVVINGSVVGPIHASDYIELQAKSNVTGDIYYKNMEIQLGAVVQGRLVYQDGEAADKVLVFKPATSD